MTAARPWQACLLAAAGALIAPATGAQALPAQATQPMAAVSAAAEDALRRYYAAPDSRLVITAGALSPLLILPLCQHPLLATVPKRASPASRVSVPVQCPDHGGWLVRVPLSMQLFHSVLVTNRPLQRGDGLMATDLHSEERDITRLAYGTLDELTQASGRTLAHPLGAGHVLTPNDLGGRRMVLAGDRVQVVAQLEGIQVSAGGIALGGGDNGARLRVRNQSSGRIIDAMIVGPGQVSALP